MSFYCRLFHMESHFHEDAYRKCHKNTILHQMISYDLDDTSLSNNKYNRGLVLLTEENSSPYHFFYFLDINQLYCNFPVTFLFQYVSFCIGFCRGFFYCFTDSFYHDIFFQLLLFFSGSPWYFPSLGSKSLSHLADNHSIFSANLMVFLALRLQWTFIDCTWKHNVSG